MILDRKQYSTFDVLKLIFRVTPVMAALQVFLSFLQAVIPTAALAVTTAHFVDTAIAVLQSIQPNDDIFVPLVLLLSVLCIFTMIGSIIQLVRSRIDLKLQYTIKPAIVKAHAALDYKHIENAESWELIARVSKDPVKSILEGFDSILLTGLYNEYEGEILINGNELRSYPAGTIKAMFSVVYQDFAKYFISLKDNIILGDITGSDIDNRVLVSAEHASLEEMIKELKDGIDTPLGKIIENGQDISGGQWQRVAIARSIISRAPIKILDEPTAALDPISESKIYEEFEKLMRGKTTVFISHRLGSTKLADEILVIDEGKIIERGTHYCS